MVAWSPEGVYSWAPGDAAWAFDARPTDAAPLQTASAPLEPGWSGEELLFWADGWAYRPSDTTWRPMSSIGGELEGAGSTWAADGLYVAGHVPGSNDEAAAIFRYDPAMDTWTGNPTPGLRGDGVDLAWNVDEVALVDRDGHAMELAPGEVEARPLLSIPFDRPVAWIGVEPVLSRQGNSTLALTEAGAWQLTGDVWTEVPGAPAGIRGSWQWADNSVVSTGTELWLYRP